MSNALAISEKYNLSPSLLFDSWSQFARNFSSASSIIPKIPMGTYLEVGDKKFGGDRLIIIRRTDFDNLNMLSSIASKVTRCLMQIDTMTTTVSSSERPEEFIKLIHQTAQIGIEFTVIPSKTTTSEYFSSFGTHEHEKIIMPKSRKEIEGK